jgi:hypothetical protein
VSVLVVVCSAVLYSMKPIKLDFDSNCSVLNSVGTPRLQSDASLLSVGTFLSISH